jgi:urea transport system permease protein
MTDKLRAAPMVKEPVISGASPLLLDGLGTSARQERRRWLLLCALTFLVLLLPPFVFAEEQHTLELLSRCLAFAILALGIDLVWGYTGLLNLGQGLYFGLGGYAVALCLAMQEEARKAGAVPGTVPPQFMSYTGLAPTHPDYVPPPALQFIAPLANIWVALAVAVLLPTLVAALFSLITFQRRIGGVYFALITQALLFAVWVFVDNLQKYTGGRVGIYGVAHVSLFGYTFNRYTKAPEIYFLLLGVLVICFLLCAVLVHSKMGRILTAIRDNENRVLALGYNTALYKTFAFTVAAALAGLSGAVFMVVSDKMGQTFIDVKHSIEFVIFVAVGGRATLLGAVVGTFLVHYLTSYLGETRYLGAYNREMRFLIIGVLFIIVVLFMPRGIMGAVRSAGRRLRRLLGWGQQETPEAVIVS